MDDLISRQAAIDAIWDGTNYDIYTREVKEILEGLPSAQRTGRWIYVEEGYCWCCSSCKTMMAEFETKPVWNYCPDCGARMEEQE